MNISENEKLKVAYALNIWTVSIKQIIDNNDTNIMQYEYDTIMNNLNLENMPIVITHERKSGIIV